jgi:hypothetical protein
LFCINLLTQNNLAFNFMKQILLTLIVLIIVGVTANAQSTATTAPDPGITVHMYRKVPGDKRNEFIKRETTYWAEMVRKELSKGNITFWALLEKVGGDDLENSSNFLFINTYNNIDAMNEIWGSITAAFPNVTMDNMETSSMSTTTSVIFLRSTGWQEAAAVEADKDFKFIKYIYHNSPNPNALVALENKHWAPFIKSTMDKKQTSQRGWGNAVLLSPHSSKMNYNSISFDLYPTLKEALNPTWDSKVVFPEGLSEIGQMETTTREHDIYRIVKVVN